MNTTVKIFDNNDNELSLDVEYYVDHETRASGRTGPAYDVPFLQVDFVNINDEYISEENLKLVGITYEDILGELKTQDN